MDLSALEEQARRRLPLEVFDYVAGGAGDELTMADNLAAWARWRLRPRVLRGVETVSTRSTVLGTELASPIMVAPAAALRIVHPDGEAAVARGAAAAGSLYVVSLRASCRPAETAAAAPEGVRWFQVYMLADRAITKDLVVEAAEHGYRALVFTVDTPVLGDRRRDVRNRFARPAGAVQPGTAQAGTAQGSQPAASPEDEPSPADRQRSGPTRQDASITFDDIAWLQELSGLPVLVKGVVRGDDAVRCLDAGAAGVVVSNHGGRQLDGAIATADALGEVVAAVGDRGEVYVDGGVRSGTDVLRALALGARGVMLGRPVLWGLAAGGADGVRAVLAGMLDELVLAMQLCGAVSLAEVTTDLLAAPPGAGA